MKSILKRIRAYTRDVAFTFRMGSGFSGDVNRVHPFAVLPRVQHATLPVLKPGQAVLYDASTNTAKRVGAGDTAVTKIQGVSVRSYPISNHSSSAFGAPSTIGTADLPTTGIIDVAEDAFMFVQIPTDAAAPTLGGAVFVWVAANSGTHVQGGFEVAASAGNTAAITNAFWQGGKDASSVAELQVIRG